MEKAGATRLTAITTCKKRLHHLKQTLPLLVAYPDIAVVVVDYGCPDGTASWVREHYPQIRIVEVHDDPGFCAARARNAGARVAETPWLMFVDADIKPVGALDSWIQRDLEEQNYYLTPAYGSDTSGTFFCARAAFERIGGYDECFREWGGEDDDLYYRLDQVGQNRKTYPNHLFEAIPHDDQERFTFSEAGSIQHTKPYFWLLNIWYRTIKYDLASLFGKSPSVDELKAIRQLVKDAIDQCFSKGVAETEVFVNLGERQDTSIMQQVQIERRLVYRISTRTNPSSLS